MNTPSVESVQQASGSSASATRSDHGAPVGSSRIGVSTSAIKITDPETIRIVGLCALAWVWTSEPMPPRNSSDCGGASMARADDAVSGEA